VFHADVIKIDRVVAMVVYACCKLLFPVFLLFFQAYVACVFIWMLHMFHTYVVSVLSRYCICFAIVFKCFLRCSCKCFRCIFQGCFKSRSGVASPSLFVASSGCLLLPAPGWTSTAPPSLLDAGNVWGGVGPAWARERRRETVCMRGRLDVREQAARLIKDASNEEKTIFHVQVTTE
jgi:hypothetical protein